MCRSEACSLPVAVAATVLPADMPFPRPRVQPMKPKLPRKLATSARINLNKYWHALEELMPVSCRAFDESDSNAINENIDNERRLAAMRLSETPGIGYSGPSNSSEGSNSPPVFSATTLGKKTSSFLKISTTSSNVLLDQSSSSITTGSSQSHMIIEDLSSSSKTSFFPSFPNTEGYPDENTPPANGPSIVGGNVSR